MYLFGIICNKCDFWQSAVSDNTLVYQVDGQDVFPKLQVEWCSDCKRFVTIQCGQNRKNLVCKIKELESKNKKIKSKLFKCKQDKESINYNNHKIDEYELLLNVLGDDDSVDACTECGSVNVEYKNINTGICRCQCGGILDYDSHGIFARQVIDKHKVIKPVLRKSII